MGRGPGRLAPARLARLRARSADPHTMTTDVSDAPADLVDWVRGVTGGRAVHLERRSAGGSRAGYSVDVEASDGTHNELWLRSDTGAGPQSNGPYTLRRE